LGHLIQGYAAENLMLPCKKAMILDAGDKGVKENI